MNERADGIADKRSAWIAPLMEWSAVERLQARLKGPIDHVPSAIAGVTLSNAGRQLYAWWLEARGQRDMPSDKDVDLRALVELLPYIRYMCWEDEKTLIVRIYGSALVEGTGLDFTGLSVFGAVEHADTAIDKARLQALHIQPCGLLMIRDVYDKTGKAYPCEFMTLPIAPDSDGKARIISTVVPCERMAEWAVDVALDRILTLRRAIFIDTGNGVPPASLGLGK
ncbi:MAG: PAS domain-containing protein [Parvibaculum sp.]|uniref:PAS domain-containing protein n=1 Tax=Parvibaculum sp. TaxID=2024848 RepID=UPI0025F6AB04|nr:PAS domain-containing protein [Parvibaculum sp.]MCE9648074.1 PAS domain-containing protein [Parvibaculum sp.]